MCSFVHLNMISNSLRLKTSYIFICRQGNQMSYFAPDTLGLCLMSQNNY